MVGLVTAASVRAVRPDHDLHTLAIAADFMQAPIVVREGADADGRIIGFLEEVDVARAYVAAIKDHASG